MLTFARMEWVRIPIPGYPDKFASTVKETERLEFESSDINDVMVKAKELRNSGWFEVVIYIDGFRIIYDDMWEN